MISFNISQFKALLSKELKEAFRDRRAMLSDVSAMTIASNINVVNSVVKGVAK